MGEAGPVRGHFAGHEDESVKHHACAHDGDPAEGLFEDDVDVAVHADAVGVADPPEIEPVSVNLKKLVDLILKDGVPKR